MATDPEDICRNLIPGEETEASEFIRQHPGYDGRGVIVGIMDTGVDPGAPGLQVTTDGKPKIVGMVDCCGDGDVDTSEIRSTGELQNGRVIKGVTGRDLTIPDDWHNPTGDWHVGVKALYQLVPKNLLNKVRKLRRQEKWDKQFEQSLTIAQEERDKFEASKESEPGEGICEGINFCKLRRDELNQRVECLKDVDKNYNDSGPAYDCIVYSDGDKWWICIDTSETGDLAACQLLRPFKQEYKHGTFKLGSTGTNAILYNYGVNVYCNGNQLSIIGMSGSHGTHVAGIVAANFPDEPQRNGIAPGAQIIVLKIGSLFVDSMETQKSLIRAVTAAIDTHCDIVNLSFGESVQYYARGQVIKRFTELTNKYNILFVSSAGNSGPALSTVGAPAASTSSIISVAAYVTRSMMEKEYSMINSVESTVYTWSSRGPIPDGDIGVTIAAPGGAIAPVPNFTEQGTRLMNGTSMASPNACGCISLILSALRSDNTYYNTSTIRSAVINTAKPIEPLSNFSMGYGLIQTVKAYQLAVKLADRPERKIWYKLTWGSKRGIYLRTPWEVSKPAERLVNVQPMYSETAVAEDKINLDLELSLEPTEAWVECPRKFNLYNQTRSIKVKVTPDKAHPGANFAEVLAYTANRDIGPLFRIPVTLINPSEIFVQDFCKSLEFKSDTKLHRHFIHIPEGVTWATLELLPLEIEDRESTFVYVHALQLLPEQSFCTNNFRTAHTLKLNSTTSLSLSVIANNTMELDIARWWTESGNMKLQMRLQFFGGSISNISYNTSIAHNGITPVKLMLYNHLTPVNISPEMKLTSAKTTYLPTEYNIEPLPEHYNIPGELCHYELSLTYSITVNGKGAVTVYCPILDSLLYENPFGSQMWFVYDSNKQLLGVGDAFSSDGRYKINLYKGTFTVHLLIMNDSRDQLDYLTNTVLICSEKISDISLPIYDNYEASILADGKVAQKTSNLSRGFYPLYLGVIPEGKIPSFCKQGCVLSGSLTIIKDPTGKSVVNTPVSYNLSSICSGKSSKKKSPKPKDNQTTEELLVEFLLTQNKDSNEYLEYLIDLNGKYPESNFHIKLNLCQTYLKTEEEDNYRKVIEIVNSIKYDKNLLILSKEKNELRIDDIKRKNEEDIQLIIKALKCKFSAINHINLLTPDADLTQLDELYLELSDLSSPGNLTDQSISHCKAHNFHALAIKLLMDNLESGSTVKLHSEITELYRKLRWDFIADRDEYHSQVLFPSKYISV
ncbi:Tripeptidyl-peptidase 2 isoform X2 [Oopsacas minuta]|uniref:tripeptidyl-peptidase II n=1 Tax=Oopsacas minuta TaxID=111878 RepID=A0AAV7KHE5_9METZ|nr:Tripeptidyl-peptidase 2 isoform X2 [Oopsacas minuta]